MTKRPGGIKSAENVLADRLQTKHGLSPESAQQRAGAIVATAKRKASAQEGNPALGLVILRPGRP